MPSLTRRDLAALLLLLTAIGAAYSALTSRLGMPSGDHVDFYLRVHQYHAELAEGHWPQILPEAVRGGGHAFPRFYPPLAHMVAAWVYPVVGDVVLASHLSMLGGVLLSGLTMFALFRALGAGTLPATLGTLVYCLFPFRATQLYVRGALAEGWAMAWYPLVALGLIRVVRGARLPWWWPLAVAASLLSHTATSLWALPAIGAAVLLAAPKSVIAVWRPITAAAGLALGLSAVSLLPVAWYLEGVRAGDPTVMLATPEAVGSFSTAWERGGMIALVQCVIVTGAILLLRRARGDLLGRLISASLLGEAALIAMGAAPAGAWDYVPQPWRYVQFGWRLITPAMFLISLAFGLLAMRFTTRTGMAVVTVGAALIALVGALRLRSEGIADPALTQERMLPWIKLPYGDFGLAGQGDYLPSESDNEKLGAEIGRTRDSLLAAGALVHDRHGRPATVRTGGASEVPLPLTAYDVFRVTDEAGRAVATRSAAGQLVALPGPTVGELRISRRLPPVVAAGMGISLLSLALVARAGLVARRASRGSSA